jgi:DNA-binding CsgD family transcriptional regulator
MTDARIRATHLIPPLSGEMRTLAPRPAQRAVTASAALRRSSRQLLAELRGNLEQLRAHHALLSAMRLPVLLAGLSDEGGPWRAYGFTDREVEVARLLAQGRRNSAIATELGISPHTARHHTQRVLAKIGVHSRAEAVARLRG